MIKLRAEGQPDPRGLGSVSQGGEPWQVLEREAAGPGLHLRKSLLRAEGEKTREDGLEDKGREGVERTVVAQDG